ncbi:MAG: hypothetical protein AAF989_12190 [Planctomycetota bacterium]
MARSKDPTEPIREKATAMDDVEKGTSCNQSSFKAGRGSFLFIGPGAKGIGFKAMFRLEDSLPQARSLASKDPDRFQVGSGGWVTARFTAEKTLPKTIWAMWLQESYDICRGAEWARRTAKNKLKKND